MSNAGAWPGYGREHRGPNSSGINGGGGRGGSHAGSGVNHGGPGGRQSGIPASFPHTPSTTTAAGYPTYDIQATGNTGSGFSNLSSCFQSFPDSPFTFGQHLSGGQSLFPHGNPAMGSTPDMGGGDIRVSDPFFPDQDLFSELLFNSDIDTTSNFDTDTSTPPFLDTSALGFQGPSNTLLHQFTPFGPAQAPTPNPQLGTLHTIGATHTTGFGSTSSQSVLPFGPTIVGQGAAAAGQFPLGNVPPPAGRRSQQRLAERRVPPELNVLRPHRPSPIKHYDHKPPTRTSYNPHDLRKLREGWDKPETERKAQKQSEEEKDLAVMCRRCINKRKFGKCHYDFERKTCGPCGEAHIKCTFAPGSGPSRSSLRELERVRELLRHSG